MSGDESGNPKLESEAAMQLTERLSVAIKHFWQNRYDKSPQAGETLDEVSLLIKTLLVENGIPATAIFRKDKEELPGFFRPTKRWDLVVVLDGQLFAAIEMKSQVGSFGNNYNNRTEEAIGSATDIWAAYREGAFKLSARPWLGYLMLLEDAEGSRGTIKVKEPHFSVFEEFRDASYAKRFELLCKRLLRESLYDAACFLTSNREQGLQGKFDEPAPELSFQNFITPLIGRALAYNLLRRDKD